MRRFIIASRPGCDCATNPAPGLRIGSHPSAPQPDTARRDAAYSAQRFMVLTCAIGRLIFLGKGGAGGSIEKLSRIFHLFLAGVKPGRRTRRRNGNSVPTSSRPFVGGSASQVTAFPDSARAIGLPVQARPRSFPSCHTGKCALSWLTSPQRNNSPRLKGTQPEYRSLEIRAYPEELPTT